MSQVLLYIPDTELVLSRLYDALNSVGHLIIVDFDKNEAVSSEMIHNGFEQEELVALMKQIGFKNIQSKAFYHAEKTFMGKDASLFILNAQK
ncbi:hypothetical protein [Desemzia sp. FAM 23991]|uniref:hypothetical protein n=1 Tax=unclassified Desemzia TaxID=2685243 RepID=UPI0038881C0B